MDRRKVVLIGATICSFLFSGSVPAAEETAAVDAAEEFLALVDAGLDDESWEEAADVFQVTVPEEEWRGKMAVVRTMFGHPLHRTIRSAVPRSALPGVPDGEYMVIVFDSAFDRKAAAIEIVTPMRGDDGIWRVAGYQIR